MYKQMAQQHVQQLLQRVLAREGPEAMQEAKQNIREAGKDGDRVAQLVRQLTVRGRRLRAGRVCAFAAARGRGDALRRRALTTARTPPEAARAGNGRGLGAGPAAEAATRLWTARPAAAAAATAAVVPAAALQRRQHSHGACRAGAQTIPIVSGAHKHAAKPTSHWSRTSCSAAACGAGGARTTIQPRGGNRAAPSALVRSRSSSRSSNQSSGQQRHDWCPCGWRCPAAPQRAYTASRVSRTDCTAQHASGNARLPLTGTHGDGWRETASTGWGWLPAFEGAGVWWGGCWDCIRPGGCWCFW